MYAQCPSIMSDDRTNLIKVAPTPTKDIKTTDGELSIGCFYRLISKVTLQVPFCHLQYKYPLWGSLLCGR